MVVDKDAKQSAGKQDLVHLAILLAIALAIGVYLIATTVLISKDGVFYIEQAQKFSSDPLGVVKAHPPGYPFLIFIAHKYAALFSNGSSAQAWIYSAQSITLLCRLLALIPLYFIGKLFVGSKRSFWAMLILVMLPYPAKIGGDVLRDWPHILFLAVGFLLLLEGAKKGKWWMFGLVGLTSGIGYLIRFECAQLVLYGVLWLSLGLLRPNGNLNRSKLVSALIILAIGFAIPAAPYIKTTGKLMPPKLQNLIESLNENAPSFSRLQAERVQEKQIGNHNQLCIATSLPGAIAKAFGKLVERISEHLMYFFAPVLLIGIYFCFRDKSITKKVVRFFISIFIVLNIIMMMLLHYKHGYMSRRHCLPLITFAIFYIPVGLDASASWLGTIFSKDRLHSVQNLQSWFFVLLVVGLVVCTPKLLLPIRIEKKAYKLASQWLMENTTPKDIVAVPDKRISFYAERKGLIYGKNIPEQAKYVVKIVADKNEEPNFGTSARQGYSGWVDKREKEKRIVVYKLL